MLHPRMEEVNKRVNKSYAMGILGAVLVVVSFIAGVFVGDIRQNTSTTGMPPIQIRNADAKPNQLNDIDFRQFWDVWSTLKEKYVKEPPADLDLFHGAVRGLVGSLKDPYSMYFDPKEAETFATQLDGEFQGIGAEIGMKDEKLTVIAPLAGTPADRAGLKAKDWIISIDGVDTSNMTVDDAVSHIRGPKGTAVKLLIVRTGAKEPKTFEIQRDVIVIEAVKTTIEKRGGKKYAHIFISQFNDKVTSQFSEAARKASLEGVSGIVLDLRNDPGGFLDTAVDVAGEWAPGQVIVKEKFKDGKVNEYKADNAQGRFAQIPTVVLVNGGSASASEIVAGALKDLGKATIVGEKSFGKGSVQEFQTFEDGSALKLTVALWYTPKDLSIDKEGITPDVEVKFSDEDALKERDPQLDKAYAILTATK